MRLPGELPAELAWWMARHGAPRHGSFAPDGVSADQALAWGLTLTWAVHLAQLEPGDPVAVLPPTLPGLCWALAEQPVSVAWLAPAPCPNIVERSVLSGRAVPWLVAGEHGFRVAFRLDPFGPFPRDLSGARAAIAPGARLVLAWRGAAGRPGGLRRSDSCSSDGADGINLGVWEAVS